MLDLVESRNLQFEVTKRAKPSSSHGEIKKKFHTETKRVEKMRKWRFKSEETKENEKKETKKENISSSSIWFFTYVVTHGNM